MTLLNAERSARADVASSRSLECGDVATNRWRQSANAVKQENLTRYLENQQLPANDTEGPDDHDPLTTFAPKQQTSHLSVVPVPKMSIVILVVGTRGDIVPFIQLGLKLKAYGHRVRVASHKLYQDDVLRKGLEYFPLGGDPVLLCKYAVQSGGRLIPKMDKKTWTKDVPLQFGMMREIINSVYPACTAPDPSNPNLHFTADAIISNPPTYAHIHVAEALGIPLHMMFPQPWTPTHAFPHPFSNEPYDRLWSKRNYYSYEFAEMIQWMGMGGLLNALRKSMGLRPCGIEGANLLTIHQIPWVKMWSPALVPKPQDWPLHVEVVGNFFSDEVVKYDPPADLANFLQTGPPPIFIGFGSIVFPNAEKVRKVLLDAAAIASTERFVIQSGWTDLRGDGSSPPNVCFIGPCAHDWLFPQLAAVIHHGGAGTVAAGLRAGRPTMVCPFSADQFFWGEMVKRAGCGAPPVPIKKLTPEVLVDSFRILRSDRAVEAAQLMSESFAKENGPRDGMAAFHKNLPVHLVVDDISIFLPEPLVANVFCLELGMKLSYEVQSVLRSEHGITVLKSLPTAPKSVSSGGRLTFFDYRACDYTSRIKKHGLWTKKVVIDKSRARPAVLFMDKAQKARYASHFESSFLTICTRKRPWSRHAPDMTVTQKREEEILNALEQALTANAIFRRFDNNHTSYLDAVELAVAVRDLLKTNGVDVTGMNSEIENVVKEMLGPDSLIHFSEFSLWMKNFQEGKVMLPGVFEPKLWRSQTTESKTAVQILQEDVLALKHDVRALREDTKKMMEQMTRELKQEIAEAIASSAMFTQLSTATSSQDRFVIPLRPMSSE